MRKAFNRFCYKYERYGIANLMTYVAGGYVIAFLFMLAKPELYASLIFYWPAVADGEVWRVVTFLLCPPTDSVFFILFAALFTAYIGRSLEQAWGKMKLTVYYFSGALLSLVAATIFGFPMDGTYLNFSLFFAFATLFPDEQIQIYFILPIKVKYLAIFQAVVFAIQVYRLPGWYRLAPVVAVANYLIFFWPDLLAILRRKPLQQFKRRAQYHGQVSRAKRAKDYTHKCAVCGLTDVDDPDMEFRYCSLCKDVPCYCSKHLFGHKHT